MAPLTYDFEVGSEAHSLTLVLVQGTGGETYRFGEELATRDVRVPSFFISTTTVTQALWSHVMGSNPAVTKKPRKPVENVSWLDINGESGFLERINGGPIPSLLAGQIAGYGDGTGPERRSRGTGPITFRLP